MGTIIRQEIFLLAFLISPFFAIAQTNDKVDKIELAKHSLAWLNKTANPEIDLRRSLSKGDTSFVGVQGYSLLVPGVQDYYRRYKSRYAVKVIPGTGDAVSTDEEFELQAKAIAYAEKYNLHLLKILKKKSEHK